MKTREEIIAAAKEAGIHENWNSADWYNISPDQLERFANIIAKAEREECAKSFSDLKSAYGYQVAEAIRARGEVK